MLVIAAGITRWFNMEFRGGSCVRPCKWSMFKKILAGTPGVGWNDSLTWNSWGVPSQTLEMVHAKTKLTGTPGVGWHDSLTLNSWGGSCLRPCKWSMLKHVKTTLTGTPGVGWHDSFTFTFEDVLHTSTIVNMEACGQNDFSMIFP